MADLRSHSSRALLNAAVSALRNQKYEEAIQFSSELLERAPEHAAAIAIAFSALFKSRRFEEARKIGGLAVKLNPNSQSILNNQACLQLEADQANDASNLWQALIERHGEKSQWLYNLGLALRQQDRFKESISSFQRTLDLEPRHDKAVFQLIELFDHIGDIEKAALKSNYLRLLRPTDPVSQSEYIQRAVSSNLISREDLTQELLLWRDQFIAKESGHDLKPIRTRTNLKLGFVIGQIPVNWWQSMILPLLTQLQKEDSVSVFWCDKRRPAERVTNQISFLDCSHLSGLQFIQVVKESEIDILVDVCGMRRGNRQSWLDLPLAKKQFGWLAHEGMYAAENVTPIETLLGEQQFCIQSNIPLTLGMSGHESKMLFGINSANGISEKTVYTWAHILLQLDGWSLHLDATRTEVKEVLVKQFEQYRIDDSRLSFDKQKLSCKGNIVLENLFANEVVNTFAAISRGSTVVALNAELFPNQRSAALLKQLDCRAWITQSQAEYIDLVLKIVAGTASRGVVDRKQLERSKIENLESFSKHFKDCLVTH